MAAYKGVVTPAKYTFDASNKTITFHADYTGIALSDIMYITNVKQGIGEVIYDPSDPLKCGSLTGLTLTLDFDTAGMNDSDPLQIIVGMSSLDERNIAQETGGNLAAIKTAVETIDNFISGSRGLVTEDNSAAIKVAVETIDNFISGARGLVTEDNSAAIKTAVETIDNFISGSRGLVTEDNSAAIKAAVETIDNFISGARGLVTEDNSAAIKTAVETIDNFISGSRGLVTEDNSAAIKAAVENRILTQKVAYGSNAVLAVTALQSLANSATRVAGWQSVMVSNLATLARNYKLLVKLTTANTAPANDKCMYVYAVPWYTTDGGSTWFPNSVGNGTLPSGSDAAITVVDAGHNMVLLGILNYQTAQMTCQGSFDLAAGFEEMPQGFSIVIINCSGAALSTNCVVDVLPTNPSLI